MKTLVLAVLVALPFAAAAQQMYKWVDEKGVTHYTDSPPPDGKASKVDIRPTPPSGPVRPPVDYKQKEIDARGDRAQKEQQAKKDAAQETYDKAVRNARCLEAQRQVQIVSLQRPVFSVNQKGEKVYLEDDKRQAEIDKWQERVKTYCEA